MFDLTTIIKPLPAEIYSYMAKIIEFISHNNIQNLKWPTLIITDTSLLIFAP